MIAVLLNKQDFEYDVHSLIRHFIREWTSIFFMKRQRSQRHMKKNL